MAEVLIYYCDRGQYNMLDKCIKFYIIRFIILINLKFVFFNAQTSKRVEHLKNHKCILSYKQTPITPD